MDNAPGRWLSRAVSRQPQRPALLLREGCLSFAELASQCAAVGERLRGSVPVGAPLALRAPSRSSLALGVYAALAQGRAVLPLDPDLPRPDQRRLMRAGGIDALFDCPLPVDPGPVPGAWVPPGSKQVGLLLPSSGSGGVPKLVMLTYGNLVAAVRAAGRRISLAAGDLWLNCLSLGHAGGLFVLLRCLRAGAGVLLHEDFDAARVWWDLEQYPVSHLSLVPPMLHRLLEVSSGRRPSGALRVVLVGGAALDPSLAARAQRAGWPLCVTYGMSETGSQVATRCGPDAGLRAGQVGQPLDGFQVRIADPDPRGIGRIWLRGPALMAGYARPGLQPGLGLQQGWLNTEDLGRLTSSGELEVLGRADAVLVSAGENVHPDRVEPLLRGCPGIGETALSACRDPIWGDLLVAVYTGTIARGTLQAYCRQHFEGALRPRRFLQLQALPLGRTGKLDRRLLRQWVERALR